MNSISIIENFTGKLGEFEARQLNVVTLAYLGDVVQDMYVRSRVCTMGHFRRISDTHKMTVSYVNANAQALSMDLIIDELTEKEMSLYKRGRNAKTMPTKNMDKAHYAKATGFETLLGYLYISGQDERLLNILNKCFDYIKDKGKND